MRRVDPRVAPERGADIHAQTSVTFEEAWHGVERLVTVTRHHPCHRCAGSGFHRIAETRCVSCEGAGTVRSVRGHMVFAKNCPRCAGTGMLRQERCEGCQGQGVAPRTEVVTVRVPAGVPDGARVRVAGKGHAGVRGGAPGDLYLDVHVEEHPMFRRDGDDVHMIAADCGARGRPRREDRRGDAGRRGAGAGAARARSRASASGCASAASPTRNGGRGDLVVEVRLALPKVLDERSKELLREFGRINGESVRN